MGTPGEKPLGAREWPTTTKPTYGTDAGIQTWATLDGGKRYHHGTTLAHYGE